MNEAAILAARRNRKVIGMAEFNEALERIVAGPERKSRLISDAEKRIIAIHEGGHAVVQRILPKCDPVNKVTIISRGMALGYTMALPMEDRYLQSKTEFEDKIAGLLGGNAAERLIFGDTTTGASNDIEKATDLARRMVTEWGMSDKMGPLAFGKRDEMIFLGREIGEQRNYSDDVAKMIDEEVRALIEHGYARATQVLTEYKAKLLALADKLIAEETVEAEEFEKLFDDLPPKENMHGIVLASAGRSRRLPRLRQRRPRRRRRRRAAGRNAQSRAQPVLSEAQRDQTRTGRPVAARFCYAGARGVRVRAAVRSRYNRERSSRSWRDLDVGRSRQPRAADAALERFLDETSDARLESYKALLRIASISGIPAHAADCRAAAEFVAADLRTRGHGARRGLARRAVIRSSTRTGCTPPASPPSCVYAHYDVQPVDPLELWESPPFVPVVKDGRMLARGASDCKCHVSMHTRAIEALMRTRGALPVNLKVVIEGEEESSSIHLDAWLDGEPRPPDGRLRRHLGHGLLRGQPAGDHGRPARPRLLPARRLRQHHGPALGRVRRRGRQPGQRALPDRGRPSRGPTVGSGCPASTTTSSS